MDDYMKALAAERRFAQRQADLNERRYLNFDRIGSDLMKLSCAVFLFLTSLGVVETTDEVHARLTD